MCTKLVPNYASASVALSFSGFLNGFDTGCIGSIAHTTQFTTSFGPLSSLVRGLTISIIMLTGVPPAIFAGALADRYGRLRVIPSGALMFALGAVLQGTAKTLPQFIVGRALAGFGQGMFLGNVGVYITEVAPLKHRGRLAALPQFMATAGVCLGYFSCYCTASLASSMAWRLPYIVQVAVAAGLALVCLSLPESPRWLMLQGRADDALRSLGMLDFDLDEARRDFLTATEQPSLSTWQGFLLLFRRGYRSRTLLALFVLAMAQLSGIDAITYVSQPAPNLRTKSPLLTNSVRPRPLPPSRHLLGQELPHLLGRRLHLHAPHLHPSLCASRQMGPSNLCHQRRPRLISHHGAHGHPLRNGSRPPDGRRAMGHCRVRLLLWYDLLRHLGHRVQDLRQRDPAGEYQGRGQFSGDGAQLCK